MSKLEQKTINFEDLHPGDIFYELTWIWEEEWIVVSEVKRADSADPPHYEWEAMNITKLPQEGGDLPVTTFGYRIGVGFPNIYLKQERDPSCSPTEDACDEQVQRYEQYLVYGSFQIEDFKRLGELQMTLSIILKGCTFYVNEITDTEVLGTFICRSEDHLHLTRLIYSGVLDPFMTHQSRFERERTKNEGRTWNVS